MYDNLKFLSTFVIVTGALLLFLFCYLLLLVIPFANVLGNPIDLMIEIGIYAFIPILFLAFFYTAVVYCIGLCNFLSVTVKNILVFIILSGWLLPLLRFTTGKAEFSFSWWYDVFLMVVFSPIPIMILTALHIRSEIKKDSVCE